MTRGGLVLFIQHDASSNTLLEVSMQQCLRWHDNTILSLHHTTARKIASRQVCPRRCVAALPWYTGSVTKAGKTLVFHNPEIVSIASPILAGEYPTRRMAYFADMADIEAKRGELVRVPGDLVRLAGEERVEPCG